MKKVFLSFLLLWVCSAGFGQYVYTFFLETGGVSIDGTANALDNESDISWSFTNVDKGCILNNANPLTSFLGFGVFMIDADGWNSCSAWSYGHKVKFELEVINPAHPLYGQKVTYEGTLTAGKSSEDITLQFQAPPSTPPSISIAGSLCAAGTATNITISNVSDYTGYSIKVFDGATDVTSSFTIGTVGATTSIAANAGVTAKTYTVKLVKGADEYTANLTVNAPLTITIAPTAGQTDGAAAYYCSGGSDKTAVTLTASASGATNYSWEKPGGSTASGAALSANAAGVYKVTATGAAGTCPGTASITVNAQTAPTAPTITPTTKDVCKTDGGSTTLAVSGAGSYTYTWTPSATGSSISVAHSGVATTAAGSSYTVKANDGKCTSLASAAATLKGHEVTVTLPTSANVNAGLAATIQPSPGSPAYIPVTTPATVINNWVWTSVSGSAIASGQGTNQIVTDPIESESKYKVQVTDSWGCTATSNEITIKVNASSVWTPTANGGSPVCQGAALAINGNVTGSAVGALSWAIASSTPSGLVLNPVTTTGNNPRWNVDATSLPGTYTVTLEATDAGTSISKTATATLTIYQKPVLSDLQIVSSDICKGGSVTLQATGSAATPSFSYVWTNATASGSDQSQATGTITKVGTGVSNENVYSVKIRDANSCESDSRSVSETGHEVTVAFTPAPPANVNSGVQQTITAVATHVPAPGTVASWTWTALQGAAIASGQGTASITTQAITALSQYRVTVEDSDGCKASKEVTINVNAGTAWEINGLGATLCKGTAGAVTGSLYSGTPAAALVWSIKSIVPATGLTLNPVTVNGNSAEWSVATGSLANTYLVTLEATDGGVAKTKEVTVKVNELPVLTDVQVVSSDLCKGGNVTLQATGTASTPSFTYVWANATASGSDQSQATGTISKAGTANLNTYSVKIRDANSCESTLGTASEIGHEVTVSPKLDGQSPATVAYGSNGLPLTATVTIVPSGTPQDYAWTASGGGSITGSTIASTATTGELKTAGSFQLKVTDNNGCEGVGMVNYTLSGGPLTATVPDVQVCSSAGVKTLTATGSGGNGSNYTYTWKTAATSPAGTLTFVSPGPNTVGTVQVTNTTPGIYHAEVEITDGIQTVVKGPVLVTINAVPVFTTIPPATQNSRVGQSVVLSAIVSPNTAQVEWSGTPMSGTATGTGMASVTAGTFAIAGVHTYNVKATNGACIVDSALKIDVLQNTEGIIITANDVEVCEGFSTINLSANATGGSSAANLNFQWSVVSGDLQLASSIGKTVTATSGSVGEHRVRITVSDASPDPAPQQYMDISVYIHAKPVINSLTANNKTTGATNVTTVNYGDEARLTASASPTTETLTYTWTEVGSTLLAYSGATVDTKPLTATATYTLTVSNAHTCKAQQSITIVVDQPANGAVLELELQKECADSGKDMVLKMKATGGNSYTFTLRNNAGTVNQSFTGAGPWTFNVSLGNQDTYYVQNFRAYKNSVEINPATVSPSQIEALFYTTPSITIAGGNVQTICEGASMTLTASSQLSNTMFTWDNGVINGQAFPTESSKIYTVTAVSDKGCTATSSVNVTLAPKPDVTISATPQQICLGDAVVLQAGGSATEFTWNNGQTVQMFTETPNVGGVLKYVVTGKELLNGCTDTASVLVTVNEPPVIASASKDVRSIAIGKDVTYGVKATGKNLTYQWQRWTGASWMSLYDSSMDTPGVKGAQTDSLTLTAVPRSWNDTRLKCVVTNNCGTVDTTFTLYVKECFDILDIAWDMCEGIRPETNPASKVDGWYCPGTKISICARLILEDSDVEIGNAVYKWTVDGLRTTDGRWDEMSFISDSSVLSWIPPVEWQDNITVALCAYVDGACDTVCKSYLRLKAAPFQEVDWKLHTSLEPTNGFCGGDTIRIWADVQGTAGKNPTFRWYNDIFDLHTEVSPTNELLTKLDGDMLVSDIRMRLAQQDSWVKVVMTPSPEVCTRESSYEQRVFMKLKPSVSPKLEIWTEDTMACLNDDIYMEARWENAGENPTFQWTRSIGFPYWDLGTKYNTTTNLDDKDVWIKCELFPSKEVCYAGVPLVDVIRITAISDPVVSISADQAHKVAGDEIIVESDLAGMPVKNPIYTWYINNLMAVGETRSELISNTFRQGDKIQLGVKGGRICQNMVMSNILTIDYDHSKRDTLIVIYRGERIRNLDMFRPGDDANEFFVAPNGYTGAGKVYMGLDGKFNYIPDSDFAGMDKVTYIVVNKYTGAVETGYIYVQVKDQEKFLIPNIITPNGDGLNDTWILSFLQDYPNHVVTVYNRNGKVVLRAKNYQNDWDGSGQGNSGYVAYFNLPNGIYTYVIDLGNKEVLKGWLEIRKDMSRGRYSR